MVESLYTSYHALSGQYSKNLILPFTSIQLYIKRVLVKLGEWYISSDAVLLVAISRRRVTIDARVSLK